MTELHLQRQKAHNRTNPHITHCTWLHHGPPYSCLIIHPCMQEHASKAAHPF